MACIPDWTTKNSSRLAALSTRSSVVLILLQTKMIRGKTTGGHQVVKYLVVNYLASSGSSIFFFFVVLISSCVSWRPSWTPKLSDLVEFLVSNSITSFEKKWCACRKKYVEILTLGLLLFQTLCLIFFDRYVWFILKQSSIKQFLLKPPRYHSCFGEIQEQI